MKGVQCMANEVKKMIELSDEQMMEIEGGYNSVASPEIIIKPYYGISVKNPIKDKDRVIPLYGIKPPSIQD